MLKYHNKEVFILNREQLANAYAIAKVLGAELSLDEFEKSIRSTMKKPSMS